jgi:glyoxylase-like metal-dependent hydrolase (beta-lactamase superfamily II)
MLTKCVNNVWMIDTMAFGRPGVVAAYLIRGKETALIDMGYASSAETVLKELERNGFEAVDYLLPTHVHLDHSGACGAIASGFNSASIRIHPKGERHLIDPAKLWAGATELFGDELMREYGRPIPIQERRLKTIADGEEINLGSGLTLRSIWTPGHASHHLSYIIEESGVVVTGDLVGITSAKFPILIPTTPPTSFNLDAAVESLQRISQLSPTRLLTPHFGVIGNALESIEANINSLKNWTLKISEMMKGGLSTDSIVNALTEAFTCNTQSPTVYLPDYLRVSIRLSVLGAVRFLKSPERSHPRSILKPRFGSV